MITTKIDFMTGISPNRIAIKTFPLEEEGLLKKTEKTREAELKKQNRGTIFKMGSKCDPWIKEGDTVSFYRNASTPVKDDDGEEYEIVDEQHILVSF